jgi:Fe-S-cluster-containing hydrogenase component 2
VHAIQLVDDVAEINDQKCIGCGLCVTACPVDALSLQEKNDYEQPVSTVQELIETVIKEKSQQH